jgi:hypothetical protein
VFFLCFLSDYSNPHKTNLKYAIPAKLFLGFVRFYSVFILIAPVAAVALELDPFGRILDKILPTQFQNAFILIVIRIILSAFIAIDVARIISFVVFPAVGILLTVDMFVKLTQFRSIGIAMLYYDQIHILLTQISGITLPALLSMTLLTGCFTAALNFCAIRLLNVLPLFLYLFILALDVLWVLVISQITPLIVDVHEGSKGVVNQWKRLSSSFTGRTITGGGGKYVLKRIHSYQPLGLQAGILNLPLFTITRSRRSTYYSSMLALTINLVLIV